MPIPETAGLEAEALIAAFTSRMECENSEDLANVLELLISKSARAIEKYSGNERAILVCNRTAYQVENKPHLKNKH